MEGSLTIVGILVAGVAGSILLDMIAWELKMSWWIAGIFYCCLLFILLFVLFYRLGVIG